MESQADPAVRVAGVRLPYRETPVDPQAVPTAAQARLLLTPSMAEPMRYLCKAWADGVPVKLEGPTGVGKTAAIRYLAHATHSEYVRVNLSYFTEVEDLLGRYVGGTGAADSGEIRWVDGPVVRALKTGAVLLLDEINLARPEVIEALNGLFDRGQLMSGREAQEIAAHPHFRVFATQNPASYAGRQDMSQALSSRWATLTWEPLPAQELQAILLDRYGDVLPGGLFGPLCAAHTALAALGDAGALGQARDGVAYTPRDLLKVADRYVRYRPKHTQAEMSDDYLVAREASEVYLGGLDDPLDSQRARAELRKALPLIDEDFYRGLILEHTATGYRLGDVDVEARSPGAQFVPTSDLVLTPSTLPVYARLLKAMDMGENVALVGERASGKSAMAEAYAAHSARPFFPEHFDAGMDGSRLMGTDTPRGWQDGLLLHAARRGGVLLADEFNLAPPEILERLNSLLDDERVLVLSENEGERLRPHRDFCFIATMNPPKYAGRHKLSRAMLNRLTCIAVPTLDAAQDLLPIVEHKLRRAHGHLPAAVSTAMARALVELHTWVSDAYKTGALGRALRRKEVPDYSLRQLLYAARMLVRFSAAEGVPQALRDALLMGYAQQGAPSDRQAVCERIDAVVLSVQGALGLEHARRVPSSSATPLPSGEQVLFRPDGVYHGETKDGLAHGVGVERGQDGSVYQGGFCNGLRHGEATLRAPEHTYEGGFAHGKFAGHGTLSRTDGDHYAGAFVAGKFHGPGTLRFADGQRYRGGFADGTFHGQGTFEYANGSRLEGEFEAGQLVEGVLHAADGTQRAYHAGHSQQRVPTPVDQGVARWQGDPFECGLAEWVSSCPAPLARNYAWAADEIRKVRAGKLDHLFLRSYGLQTLPPEIAELAPHLTRLTLAGNPLTRLPPEIGHLVKLEHLNACGCELVALPATLGKLQALEMLYVANNALCSLPPELGQCRALRQLSVHSNRLQALPRELGQLENLVRLRAANNRLEQLPDTVCGWRSIEAVELEDNLLVCLPAGLSAWSQLQTLGLARNPRLIEVGAGLQVASRLDLAHCRELRKVEELQVGGIVDFSGCTGLQALPAGFRVGQALLLVGCTGLQALPANLWVGTQLHAKGCTALRWLGPNIHVGGACYLQDCTALEAVTEPLDVGENLLLHRCVRLTKIGPQVRVGGWLELRHCTAFVDLPEGYAVGGGLDLQGCTALVHLPADLDLGAGLDLSRCSALRHMGAGLGVAGDIDLRGCGQLSEAPLAQWQIKPHGDGRPRRIFIEGSGISPAAFGAAVALVPHASVGRRSE